MYFYVSNKSKEEGRDQESIQSSTTPDPGHLMNTRKHHTQKNQELSLSHQVITSMQGKHKTV